MNNLPRFAVLAALSMVALPAAALQPLPGLWEFSTDNVQVDGRPMPGVSEMIEQMANLPAQQRQMMEETLAAQGVRLGERGVRICLSEAQVQSKELPFQGEAGCTQQVTEQSERAWSFRFECPEAQGQGATQLISEREVVSQIESTYQVGTQQGTSRMQSRGTWLSEDCAGLPPAR